MKNMKHLFLFFSLALCSSFLNSATNLVQKKECQQKKIRSTRSLPAKIGRFFCELAADAVELNVNLFSLESVHILTGVLPFYLSTRFIDERFQSNFYDRELHKNINQFPQACHQIAQKGIAIPMVVLSSLAVLAHDPEIRYTGRMIAIGLPFVHSGKDILKKLRAKCCLRPWHEDFDQKKRSSGGFPSGHMANIAFMATLGGLRFGPKWGVPVGLFGLFVFADFVNCNRHYLSQMLAGATLGALYAVSASKVIDRRLTGNFSYAVTLDRQARPGLQLSYVF